MTRVSNQTNNTDPLAVNSRIFVGNLNTYVVEKESVEARFRCYGLVVGISMHKGYAFVQFTDCYDARNAVLGEDGRTFAGQVLDVNMVSEPKAHQLSRKRMVNSRSSAQPSEILPYCLRQGPAAPPIKRLRNDLLGSLTSVYLGGNPMGLQPPNAAIPPQLITNGVRSIDRTGKLSPQLLNPVSCNNPDLLICGTCKELFTSLQGLADHKHFSCRLRFTCKCQDNGVNANAPATPSCARCNAQCETWFELIQHVETSHGISIYRREDDSDNGPGDHNGSLSSSSSLVEENIKTPQSNGNKPEELSEPEDNVQGNDTVMSDDQTSTTDEGSNKVEIPSGDDIIEDSVELGLIQQVDA